MPDATSRAAAVASIQATAGAVAGGQWAGTSELPPAAASGIAEAFSNPLQHIREDFGSARFDQIFSDKDSLAAVYTIDDSEGHSPSNNPFTFVDIFLREQVASLSETHVFSPSVVNKATFGFSRGEFLFQ